MAPSHYFDAPVAALVAEFATLDTTSEPGLSRAQSIISELATLPDPFMAQEAVFAALLHTTTPILAVDAATLLLQRWLDDPELATDGHALFLMAEGGAQRLLGWYGLLWCAQGRYGFPADKFLHGFERDLLWAYHNSNDEPLRIAMATSPAFLSEFLDGLEITDGMLSGHLLEHASRTPADVALAGLRDMAQRYICGADGSPLLRSSIESRIVQLVRNQPLSMDGGRELVALVGLCDATALLIQELQHQLPAGPARDHFLRHAPAASSDEH